MGFSRFKYLCAVFSVLFFLSGCMPDKNTVALKKGCKSCHKLNMDMAHDFSCDFCHSGDPQALEMKEAHNNLVKKPAHPDFMEKKCGKCHGDRVSVMAESLHFTLENEIATVWSAFFGEGALPSDFKKRIPDTHPETENAVVLDMLHRRCLRCHVRYGGDDYSAVAHGAGCAACHMSFSQGFLTGHEFLKSPGDAQCLSCHYGNFTGWDFYGRYEIDYPADFTTRLVKGRVPERPYGLGWHNMTPDIHKKAGFRCVSCHKKDVCASTASALTDGPTCISCHSGKGFDESIPGHDKRAQGLVDCSACHAVWSYNDFGRSLLRQDLPDWGEWLPLARQGSSEVERQVMFNNRIEEESWRPGFMTDKVVTNSDAAGLIKMPGIWFSGFTKRRWSPVVLGETCGGRLRVIRPLLDIAVSYLDGNDEVIFDNLKPAGPVDCHDNDAVVAVVNGADRDESSKPWLWRPYVPHTTGAADFYRTMVVLKWLEERDRFR